jgi:SAM-dependent methyltransferase
MSMKDSVVRVTREAFEHLPEGLRTGIRREQAKLRGLGQLKKNQAMLAQRLARLERGQGPRATADDPEDARFPLGVRSRVCTQAQLDEPWFSYWCSELGRPAQANRKLWEHTYIAYVLDALGCLAPQKRGLGFGVGREPLVSLFAQRGVAIVATDLELSASGARGWSNSDQHAPSVESMLVPALIAPERFAELVTWQPVDMAAIPADLKDFDFCWSSCSLEHLGSLEAGQEFVEQSIETLAPGGIAIHTTEYNLTSNDATIDRGHTVLYRDRDLRSLATRLEQVGHQVAALNLLPGHGVLDEYLDLPPYVMEPHLRLLYRKFATTSVALVIRAGSTTG